MTFANANAEDTTATTGLVYRVNRNDHPALTAAAWIPLATSITVPDQQSCTVQDSNVTAVTHRIYRIVATTPEP